jgi:GNAT superfamily N-acetyltransferase
LRIIQADGQGFRAAAELARRVYGSGPIASAFSDPSVTLERWGWLAKNPEGGSPAWVAMRGGDVVGHVAILPVTVSAPSGLTRAAWARDLMVSPDVRGSGLGSQLIRTALTASGGQLLLGGLNPNVSRMYRKLGYQDMGAIPSFVLPVRARAVLERLGVPSVVAAFGGPIARVTSRLLSTRSRGDPVHVTPLDAFDARFDDWWSQIEPSLGCVVRRTSATMRWRYVEHPVNRYRAIAAWRDGALRAVVVARSGTTRGLPSGHIVELLAAPTDTDAALRLIDAAIDLLMADDPVLLRCSTTSSVVRTALIRSGFLPAPAPFRWMLASPEGRPLGACPRWTITSGDSDLDAI